MKKKQHGKNEQRYPLEGIKILDLSTQIPGPYCTMLLADLGADVIKIENTDGGDQARLLPHLFNHINRNKKSIALNLKSSKAREIFYKLAKGSDVIVEGFRPGVCKKLKVDYATIREINPGIIYCSVSGYGQEGPYRDKPGHDINYLGYSGFLSLEGDLNHDTGMPPISLADIAGSMFAAVSILTALIHRDKTAMGQYIDVSMTAALFSWLSASITAGFQGQPEGESLFIPHYGRFKTRDDQWITLGIVHEEHFWKNLCSVMKMGALARLDLLHRVIRREDVVARLRKNFLTKNLHEWLALLNQADVPCGPVYRLEESYADPQVLHRASVFEIDMPAGSRLKQRAFPAIFSRAGTRKDMPPPEHGQHTAEILRKLSYTEKEIEGFLGKRIIH